MLTEDRTGNRILAALAAVVVVVALVVVTSARLTQASGAGPATAFTLQGTLSDGDQLASGDFDFRVELQSAPTGGASVAPPVTIGEVTVVNGRYAFVVDFGLGPFDGQALWLEMGVRDGSDTGPFDILAPRTPMTSVPYAIRAIEASNVGWTVGAQPEQPSSAAPSFGQISYSSGSFVSAGDAQTSTYVLRRTIAGNDSASSPSLAATNELFLDGVGQRVHVSEGKTILFTLTVVAFESPEAEPSGSGLAAYKLEGLANNSGGVTSGIITSESKIYYQGIDTINPFLLASLKAAKVTFDDELDAVRVYGSELFFDPARWVAKLETIEVGW